MKEPDDNWTTDLTDSYVSGVWRFVAPVGTIVTCFLYKEKNKNDFTAKIILKHITGRSSKFTISIFATEDEASKQINAILKNIRKKELELMPLPSLNNYLDENPKIDYLEIKGDTDKLIKACIEFSNKGWVDISIGN